MRESLDKYLPENSRLVCPLPMRWMDAQLTLWYLDGVAARVFLRQQSDAKHQKPPLPPIEEVEDYPPLPAGLDLSAPWVGKNILTMPAVVRGIAWRNYSARAAGAIRCLEEVFNQQYQHRAKQRARAHAPGLIPAERLNLFGIWAVKVRGAVPASADEATIVTILAEHELVHQILDAGHPANIAAGVAARLVYEIEELTAVALGREQAAG